MLGHQLRGRPAAFKPVSYKTTKARQVAWRAFFPFGCYFPC